ncbi:MAG: Glu-tRNA(Gln) amidotransferase subunit GatD [Candidatus Aenigmarchaeota archaeon]|nr:Glu-tRNA(Gln) amidotransferase subunit GatD [Candidatus Aenigmarchaeota archaeon]
MDYSKTILDLLKKSSVKIGDKILMTKSEKEYSGIVMPNTGSSECIVLKLDSGYNIGIEIDEKTHIKKLSEEAHVEGKMVSRKLQRIEKLKFDPKKPTIAILNAGGTIASRIDYRTGGVTPVFTSEELVSMVPELAEIANIRCKMVFQMWSEDMEPEHWQILAKEIAEEIEEGCEGIIITHGTDYLHYTAAILAFMVQSLPIPVLIVGSQRSSDRGSSDGAMNLICASKFIASSDFSGVAICMHANSSDNSCYILPACKTRKMHTSRRDAFRPINSKPIAIVDYKSEKIEFFLDYQKKDYKRKLILETRYDKKIALIKSYPGFRAEQLDWYEKNCNGIIFEGSGMAGNLPINILDDHTKHHKDFLEKLKKITEKTAVYMTSQCIFGRLNMNVYTTGRDLQAAGCQPAYMIPEVALVKLGWILGQTKDPKQIKEMMEKDFAGEIIERSELDEFPPNDL